MPLQKISKAGIYKAEDIKTMLTALGYKKFNLYCDEHNVSMYPIWSRIPIVHMRRAAEIDQHNFIVTDENHQQTTITLGENLSFDSDILSWVEYDADSDQYINRDFDDILNRNGDYDMDEEFPGRYILLKALESYEPIRHSYKFIPVITDLYTEDDFNTMNNLDWNNLTKDQIRLLKCMTGY